jgi:NADP-dependent 3-hydroxy acid dehydrogenase YdfG
LLQAIRFMYPGWSSITGASSNDEVQLLEEEARHQKLELVLTDIRDQINESIAELYSAGMRSVDIVTVTDSNVML